MGGSGPKTHAAARQYQLSINNSKTTSINSDIFYKWAHMLLCTSSGKHFSYFRLFKASDSSSAWSHKQKHHESHDTLTNCRSSMSSLEILGINAWGFTWNVITRSICLFIILYKLWWADDSIIGPCACDLKQDWLDFMWDFSQYKYKQEAI